MKNVQKVLTLLFVVTLLVASCTKKEDPKTPAANEFIADNTTFVNYKSWPLVASHTGPDSILGTGHFGNDSTVIRDVYVKDNQDRVSGSFPVGTAIVKHIYNPGGTVKDFVAMAKRGNNFNPGLGDWEFFLLNEDGTIAENSSGMQLRGTDLAANTCKNCHVVASAKDYIFSK